MRYGTSFTVSLHQCNFIGNTFCMGLLFGRTECLTVQNGGFWHTQVSGVEQVWHFDVAQKSTLPPGFELLHTLSAGHGDQVSMIVALHTSMSEIVGEENIADIMGGELFRNFSVCHAAFAAISFENGPRHPGRLSGLSSPYRSHSESVV